MTDIDRLFNKIASQYRNLIFKSMNSWLTSSEQEFVKSIGEMLYGKGYSCSRYPSKPSAYMIKSRARKFNIQL